MILFHSLPPNLVLRTLYVPPLQNGLTASCGYYLGMYLPPGTPSLWKSVLRYFTPDLVGQSEDALLGRGFLHMYVQVFCNLGRVVRGRSSVCLSVLMTSARPRTRVQAPSAAPVTRPPAASGTSAVCCTAPERAHLPLHICYNVRDGCGSRGAPRPLQQPARW